MNYLTIKTFKEYLKKFSILDHDIIKPLLQIVVDMKHFTFHQILKKINNKNASFLNLIYFSPKEMQDFSKKSDNCKKIFDYLDINKLGKIDAFELFAFTHFVIEGPIEETLEYLITNFGDKTQNTITKDEFFYFVDGFYRAITKFLLNQNQNKGICWRLSYVDIEEMTKNIFQNDEFISIEDLQNYFLNNKQDPHIDFFFELKKSFNQQITLLKEKEQENRLNLKKKLETIGENKDKKNEEKENKIEEEDTAPNKYSNRLNKNLNTFKNIVNKNLTNDSQNSSNRHNNSGVKEESDSYIDESYLDEKVEF